MKTLTQLSLFLQDNHALPSLLAEGAGSSANTVLSDLWLDSRSVTPQSVFIALQGTQTHGIAFMDKAAQQGACCILLETSETGDKNLPGLTKTEAGLGDFQQTIADFAQQYPHVQIWGVDKLSDHLAVLANWFYNHPSRQLKVVGITGTNGKTSSAHYTVQLLADAGYASKVALMGTLGNGVWPNLEPSPNTTLETVSLTRWLHQFVQQGVAIVVMEVSSHAVSLARIAGVEFEVLALTQVTRDHLDFHGSEAAYRDAKKALFLTYPCRYAVLNLEDSVGQAVVQALAAKTNPPALIGYHQNTQGKIEKDTELSTFIEAQQVLLTAHGITGKICLAQQCFDFQVALMGQFNVENLLCATGIAHALGVDVVKLAQAVPNLVAVTGRMQVCQQTGCATTVIDYAHTPDALEALLKAVSAHLSAQTSPPQIASQLWVVFGCGGDRDQGKRPLMAEVAERYATQIILTDDNPRGESAEAIIEHIASGFKTLAPTAVLAQGDVSSSEMSSPNGAGYQIIHDRPQAIFTAVRQAAEHDIVIVAGKGHEAYQEIKGQRLPMSDQQSVLDAMEQKQLERGE